jgi:hypothetical protein
MSISGDGRVPFACRSFIVESGPAKASPLLAYEDFARGDAEPRRMSRGTVQACLGMNEELRASA